MSTQHIGERVVIVGSAGTGKTTLATALAERLDLRHVELDALHWGPNWQLPTVKKFQNKVSLATSTDRWVADGNYSKSRQIVWSRAQAIIWLDLPLLLIVWRLIKRGVSRSLRKEILWNGNRESLRGQFFSKDSLIFYTLRRHRSRKQELPDLFKQYPHLTIFHLTSPRQVKQFIKSLPAKDILPQ